MIEDVTYQFNNFTFGFVRFAMLYLFVIYLSMPI